MVLDAMPTIGIADLVKRPFFHVDCLTTAVKQNITVSLYWKMNAVTVLKTFSIINMPVDFFSCWQVGNNCTVVSKLVMLL